MLGTGTVLGGRYELEEKLGQGGMGVVWAATDVKTGEDVAVKLLASAGDDAKALELRHRLRREARAATTVVHPRLCRILDVLDLEDGSPALVMERLRGESLASRLERVGKLDLGTFSALFVEVLEGVSAVHAQGIVHRDLKPENVFLVEGPPPAVKVLDFGIAKMTATDGLAPATASLTATGAMLGTPFYMSPEQFGSGDVDARADVWSLGLLAYRCLSGVLPTRADNVFEVFRRVVDCPLPPLREAAPWVPADVAAMVDRMLARKRGDRPGDLAEILTVFARHARDGAVSGAHTGDSVPSDRKPDVDALATTYAAPRPSSELPTDPPALPRAASPAPAVASAPRRTTWQVGVGLAAVAMAAGVVWTLRSSSETPAAATTRSTASASVAPPSAPSLAPSLAPSAVASSSVVVSASVDAPAVSATASSRARGNAKGPAARVAPTASVTATVVPTPPPAASLDRPPSIFPPAPD
jgi:serine/threonine-protein kinase